MTSTIEVNNLSKIFHAKVKEAGLKGSLKAIVKPKFKKIAAVKNISFNVNKGELVAFIGPNGAGKSTTLKMLSGILFPDEGSVSVGGFDPTKQRKQLAFKIGTVFGQKSQLWFHLPAIDSFNLFAKIYELEPKAYKKRLNQLIKQFEIGDLINQPIRKLSLGQRMRCEFVLALLHNPEILFLDEPTIGLDVTVKKNIRQLINKINQEEKVTVILTSHDMGDIEHICDRAIIINKGCIVFDGAIKMIKQNYLKHKIINARSEGPIKNIRKAGVKTIKKRKFAMKLEIDTKKVKIKTVIDLLLKENDIEDITVEEPPIEDIIETIYKE